MRSVCMEAAWRAVCRVACCLLCLSACPARMLPSAAGRDPQASTARAVIDLLRLPDLGIQWVFCTPLNSKAWFNTSSPLLETCLPSAAHPPLQAADDDVEGVVLDAGPDGALVPPHICRGPGSFKAHMVAIGEPVADGEGDGKGDGEAGGAEGGERHQQEREELQAATVS